MSNISMGLQMKMGQQLIMTPQLQQAIKLLQLSRVELEELIEQSLVENPVLEVETEAEKKEESIESKEVEQTESETNEEAKDFIEEQSQLSYDEDWQNYIESGSGVIQENKTHAGEEEENNFLEAAVSRKTTLVDHLLWQLEMTKCTEEEEEVGIYIIGNIDEDGYLSLSIKDMIAISAELRETIKIGLEKSASKPVLDEVAVDRFEVKHDMSPMTEVKKKSKKKKSAPIFDDKQVEEQQEPVYLASDAECSFVEKVLHLIQQFDPPGVGGRNLQECLEIQLKMLGRQESLAFSIIQADMKLLEHKDLKKIARRHKVDIDKVVEAYDEIISLEPKPARPFQKEPTQYAIPDVFIYKNLNEFEVQLNQESLPKLRINSYYLNMIREKEKEKNANKSDKKQVGEEDLTDQYILEKIKAGEWLMKSIDQRQKTIYRVAESILKHQKEFFIKGLDYLKPMVLKDVAEDIEVHESTVSRITTNKFMHTPQGIFEFKYFFTSGISQADGDIISSKKIKDHIRKLVEIEDSKKPYTDIQIAEELRSSQGIRVARRTVAKYREALNILPSNRRKRLF